MPKGKHIIGVGVLLMSGVATFLLMPGAPGPAPGGANPGFNERPSVHPSTNNAHSPRGDRVLASMLREALESLEASSAEEEKSLAMERIIAGWPRHRLATAVAEIFGHAPDGSSSDQLRGALLDRWAASDPVAAAAWAANICGDGDRETAVTQVALVWSAIDSAAAWDWVSALPAGPPREAALLSLAYEVSRDDPSIALERCAVIGQGIARDRLVEHAMANLAAIDPVEALARTRAIDNPELKNNALASLATGWAESDPHAAATLVVGEMDSGPAFERAVIAVVQRWTQQSPDEVHSWVTSFPDGPLKETAFARIAELTSPLPVAGGHP